MSTGLRLPGDSALVGRDSIPDAPPVLVQSNTGAPNALLLGAPAIVWEARLMIDAGNRAQGEQALRSATKSQDAATAWAACNELGVVLAMTEITRDETPETREGLGYLLTAATAPYADVAAAATWNLSQILRLAGRASTADRYAWTAHDLGDPVALDYAVDSSLESSSEEIVRQTLVSTVRAGSRLHRGRIEAEKKFAEHALEAASVPAREWFLNAQGKLVADDWSSITRYDVDTASYNVENNLVALTVNGDMIPMLAGFGDGIYPVISLSDESGTVGALTVFKNLLAELKNLGDVSQSVYSLAEAGPGAVLGSMLESAAPLILRTVTVSDSVTFGDAGRQSNGRDVLVDVNLPAGEYGVVVWMSIPVDSEDTIMRPLAFGLVRGSLLATLNLRLPSLQPSEVDLILNESAFNQNVRFSRHTSDVVPGLLRRNFDAEVDEERRLSWLLQLAEVEADETTFAAVHGFPTPDEDRARRALARRGYSSPVLVWKSWPSGATAPAPTASVAPASTTPVAPVVPPASTAPVESVTPPVSYVPPTPAPAPSASAFCTSCGAKRTGASKFCTHCGAKFAS